MADIGYGYGSECHLLRYLGRHRALLDQRMCQKLSAASIRWLDFHFDPTTAWKDGERKGLDFLPRENPATSAWGRFWPRHGNPPNWDAVAVASIDGVDQWVLVEAKGHVGELRSDCQASEEGGLSTIRSALDETKRRLGISLECDWLHRYYQLANRLAVLNFLTQQQIPAHLMLIYFMGDNRPDGHQCPRTEAEWQTALDEQDRWLGLKPTHGLSSRIHKLFLSVIPDEYRLDPKRRDKYA